MDKIYRDMFELFECDTSSREYFDSLPDYVREQITTRSKHVNSLDALQGYADKLLRGDD